MFRRAHALAPSARTFGQMGLVETSLKRWVDAETHLAMSLSNPDDGWVDKNRTFLDEALAICRQHVGELVVSGPAGAEVFVGRQLRRDASHRSRLSAWQKARSSSPPARRDLGCSSRRPSSRREYDRR